MINDSQIRLHELEVSYKRLQRSHAKLLADHSALGGKIEAQHIDGSVDPEDEKVHIVIEHPRFLTPEEVANDLMASLRLAIKDLNK